MCFNCSIFILLKAYLFGVELAKSIGANIKTNVAHLLCEKTVVELSNNFIFVKYIKVVIVSIVPSNVL